MCRSCIIVLGKIVARQRGDRESKFLLFHLPTRASNENSPRRDQREFFFSPWNSISGAKIRFIERADTCCSRRDSYTRDKWKKFLCCLANLLIRPVFGKTFTLRCDRCFRGTYLIEARRQSRRQSRFLNFFWFTFILAFERIGCN